MHDEVEEDEPVAIFAEGKEHALGGWDVRYERGSYAKGK